MNRILSGALLLACAAALAMAPQRRQTLTARAVEASLGEAMERAYTREVSLAHDQPPYSLEDIQEVALSWRVMSVKPQPKARASRPSRRTFRTDGPLDVAIDKLDSEGGRATATVTKRFDGPFYRRPNKSSRVRATATFRHLWMKNGGEWLLMTSTLTRAQMSIDGKAFTPDRKYWNPNNSFRASTPLNPIGPRDDTPP